MGAFLGQLNRKAADYHPTPERPALSEAHAGAVSQADTSGYRMHLDGAVLPHGPGDVVEVEGQQHLIHAVTVTGHPQQTTASQQFQLQPLALPLATDRKTPQWPSRTVWAYVTDNEKDPLQQGRIQVEFEPEPLDPQPSGARAWLHTLAPYGGGAGPGGARLLPSARSPRAHGYAGGFYSLPEVGERVLVEFLGQWDSEAVVLGAVRHGGVAPADSARDTKRWRTPSGNEVALTTQGEGTAATDVVSVHARDHVVLQAVVDSSGESVSVQCGGSYVHLVNKGGSARVEVVSGGSLLVHAAGHVQIEGDSVQIKAKGGAVRVSDVVVPASGALWTPRKAANKGLVSKKKAGPKSPVAPSSKFDCAMKFLGNAEGGYTVDQGGPTMYGVTQAEYGPYARKNHPNDPQWPDLSGHPEDMRRLTQDHALEIFRSNYWDSQCEDLPLPLAICRLDTRVQTSSKNNHSTAYIAKGLGLPEGAPWAQVKAAADQATPAGITKAVDSYLQGRIEFYHWLGTHGTFAAINRKSMQGWANRLGVPNPYASSAKAAQRSQQAHGDGLKQFIEKLDKNCPGCK